MFVLKGLAKGKKVFIGVVIVTAIIISIVLSYHSYREKTKQEKILERLTRSAAIISSYCEIFSLPPREYVSVIYSELINNWNEFDDLDDFRAEIGFDPSAGFAQMRLSTLLWIEDNLTDSVYIKKSLKRSDAIKKLLSDSTNIIYSIRYVKEIQNEFINKYNMHPSIACVGSYYGRGIDRGVIVDSSYINIMGKSAHDFFWSNDLMEEYPR